MGEQWLTARARRFLGSHGAGANGAMESAGARSGPPDQRDVDAIAATLSATRAGGPIAAMLVARARSIVTSLEHGASPGSLDADDLVALESVIRVRGRPSLAVEGERMEPLDDEKHPGSGFWRTLANRHEESLVATARATGAVVVSDLVTGAPPRVQGTAWLISGQRLLTNRHVLLPLTGMRLARRDPSRTTQAVIKPDVEIAIDFANDNGPPRSRRCRVLGVEFVAEEGDPVDVAVLSVSAEETVAATVAALSVATTPVATRQVYVVGHPGLVGDVSPEVLAVFGTPDGRKRISFGELMPGDPERPGELAHDASTIGGFSGGCVVPFGSAPVAGLHYYGDPVRGNRAISAIALREHPVAAFLS